MKYVKTAQKRIKHLALFRRKLSIHNSPTLNLYNDFGGFFPIHVNFNSKCASVLYSIKSKRSACN